MQEIIVIAIGKNEEAHIDEVLSEAAKVSKSIIYVDSKSKDKSVELARKYTTHVVLMPSEDKPSASHARNLGFNYAIKNFPDVEWIQFIDADSKLFTKWPEVALDYLKNKETLGAVCGYVNEKCPEQSIYNLLCQMEWSRDLGKIESCGGNALIRTKAFKDVIAFNTQLIAGEEAEFYGRMRLKNWEIHRIPHDMVLHDANMHYFSEWWKRSIRAGAAVAFGLIYYPLNARTYVNKQLRSLTFWTLILPISTLLLSVFFSKYSLSLLLLYPLLVFRILRDKKKIHGFKEAFIYAVFTLIQKIPMSYGLIASYMKHLRRIN